MRINTLFKNTDTISKISTGIIFLALILCISEPFRLQYYSATPLIFSDIKPFLIGAMVTALALLIMTILFYFGKHRMILGTCILTIVILLIVKRLYLIQ